MWFFKDGVWLYVVLFLLLAALLVIQVWVLTYNGPTEIDIHDFVNNNDFNIPIGEEYELDRMLPYVANETDDGLSVTVYFERVESDVE